MPISPAPDGEDTRLTTCVVTQIVPVDLELGVIVHVNEFVHQGVFHMTLAEKSTLAENDGTCLRAEASCPGVVTRSTQNVFRGHLTA